ncbi:MAG: heavy-metal-associated domain-containing protein [Anaerolineales bacterium]|nr:heavy-metal-associated domain-containing protein [Anaerolineales bacterium]
MKNLTLEVPAMYGDHHVVEVRRLLLEMPGVKDVYASSSFHTVEVSYDPELVADAEIQRKLEEVGYLGDLSLITEAIKPPQNGGGKGKHFRHTAIYEQTKDVSFAQVVNQVGRPLWPCPGVGTIKGMDEEN